MSANNLNGVPKPWDPWASWCSACWSVPGSSSPAVTHLPQVLPLPSAWPLQAVLGSPSAIAEGHSCGEGSPRLNSQHASCLPRDVGSYGHGVGGAELRVWWAVCQEMRGGSKLWTSTHHDPLLLYTKHFLFKQPHARITQDGSSSSCGHIWH